MKQKILFGFGKIKNQINKVANSASSLIPDEHLSTHNLNKFLSLIRKSTLNTVSYNNTYYSKSNITDNPILFIAVVSFHHKKGSIVEFTFPSKEDLLKNENTLSYLKSLSTLPPQSTLDDILNQLTYLCLPDGSHYLNKDSQFFLIQNFSSILYGISCYEQLRVTQAMKEDDQENTRECVQKAMCIVSKIPLFGQMASKLSVTMSAYFNQNSLKDKSIINALYSNYDTNIFSSVKVNEIMASFSLKNLFVLAKEKVFELMKLLMLEKRILVFSNISHKVCSFVFSLVSLFPGNGFFTCNYGEDMKNYNKCYEKYGLPLKFFREDSKFYSLLSLYDIEKVEGCKSFLIGTTNQLFLTYNKLKFDYIINLDENKMGFVEEKKINHSMYKISKIEKSIYKSIIEQTKEKTKLNNEEENYSNFEIAEDSIRKAMNQYIMTFLIDMSLLLYLSSQEDTNEKDIKIILKNYNSEFIQEWITTKNYFIWKGEQAKDLWMQSSFVVQSPSSVTIFDEQGNCYKGEYGKGMKNGKGNYSSKDNQYIYDGNWINDKKEGNGDLFDHGVKYSGFFKNDLFEGAGNLIDKEGNIYEGEFINGTLNGMGHMIKSNGESYVGMFKEGLFNGKGQLTTKGDIYDGEFIEGKKQGMGVLIKENGDKYEGNFDNDIENGEGKLTKQNGEVITGVWIKGELQK